MKWSRVIYLALLVVVAFFLYTFFFWQTDTADMIQLNEVAQLIRRDQIKKVVVQRDTLLVELKDGSERTARKEPESSALEALRTDRISIQCPASMISTSVANSQKKGLPCRPNVTAPL